MRKRSSPSTSSILEGRRKLKAMPVPLAAALRAGVAVNIMLKKDQPTGRLTKGQVADVLTRGNHPRGVKVRLTDGQIGRVQSLDGNSGPFVAPDVQTLAAPVVSQTHVRRNNGDFRFQDDFRNDSVPVEKRSLEDYVTFKAPRNKKGQGKRRAGEGKDVNEGDDPPGPLPAESIGETTTASMQDILAKEFPTLDSSLVAAIVSDTQSMSESRKILEQLAYGG